MKLPILSVILSLTALLIQAQPPADRTNSQNVTGEIISSSGPIAAGTIRILYAKDSAISQTTLSDSAGRFRFDHLLTGNYLLLVEALGYQIYYSSFSLTPVSNNYHFSTLLLTAKTNQLDQVVVTAHPPMVEQKLDKTVIHVDASPSNTGLNTLDILEKSPGISLDKDGAISLNGKPGPLVLIDGKPTYLGAGDLASLLQSMPGSQLDQIEIMSNPPAKYDAAGNAGVINIRTKKGKQQGFNGSVTLGGGLGIHPRSTNSFNLNYHTGKVNLFANYSYNYTDRKNEFHLFRNIRDAKNQTILQSFSQTTIFHPIHQAHTFKTGLDYAINKKTTIGFAVTGLFNPTHEKTGDTTHILDPKGVLDSITVSNSKQRHQFNNIGTNLNFHHEFTRPDQELNADLDYLHYHSGSDQSFNNYFYDAQLNTIDPASDLFVHLPARINIYSAKADYTQPLADHLRLDLGAKASFVRADNNAQYFDGADNTAPVDNSLTNHFLYKEDVQAGYVNLNKKFSEKWTAQAGLRVEHTFAEGDQLVSDQDFRRDYTQLFPTAYVEYALNANNKFAVDYGRRIQRPDYQDLNPFLYFLDKYTFTAGNPDLQPQLSNTIELKHSFKDFLTSSLSYSKTDNIISSIVNTVDSTKIAFETTGNIASSVYYAASVGFNHAITSWWKMNVFAEETYQHLNGTLNNEVLDLKKYEFLTNVTSQFDAGKGLSFELSGNFNTGPLYGTFRAKANGSINLGISKQVFDKKGSLRLSIRDLANTLVYANTIRYQNEDMQGRYKPDSRVVSLSFTYRFSKGKSVKQRSHTSASEEEQNRVKSAD